jgi:uncharacterized membrane protein
MLELGVLPGDTASSAYAASRDGSIIVGGSTAGSAVTDKAFIWTRDRGMRSLRDVLINDFGYDLSRWIRLREAFAISPDGRYIVGWGDTQDAQGRKATEEAFLAILPAPIPEPSSVALAGLGLAALLGDRWRRSRRKATGVSP